MIGKKMKEHISKIELQCEVESFGAIYKDIVTLMNLFEKIIDYYSSKIDRLGSLSRSIESDSNRVMPLF